MAPYEVEKSALKPLDDGNYPIWSMGMEADFVERKLWKFVDGNMVEPKGDTAEEKKTLADFREKQAMARSRLIAKVSDGQLPHMVDNDPAVIWKELARVHRAQGFGSRLATRRRFWNTKMLPDEKMSVWISRVKAQLEAAGANLHDEDIILVLTNGLPSSYEAVVIAIDGIPTDQINLNNVIIRLRNEEGRKGAVGDSVKVEEDDYGNQAMYARAERTSNPVCFECGRRGHFRSKCPELELRRKDGKPSRVIQDAAGLVTTEEDEREPFAF